MIHEYVSDDHCYHCKLRGKNLTVAPSATPSRMNNVRPRRPDPAWERGRAGEHRVDGSFMPYFKPGTRSPLPIKEYGERRREIDEKVRRVKTSADPA